MKKTEIFAASGRRRFIQTGLKIAVFTGLAGVGAAGCVQQPEGEDDVTPTEDLMQEHGLLNRALLIYDECRIKLESKADLNRLQIYNTASIIRTFVEDYHEKQEEDYLFPRFEKMNQQTELVRFLRAQHKAGRTVTEKIMQLSKAARLDDAGRDQLINLLQSFCTMYRPHESREDTVLFPAFRKLVTRHEFHALGEEFERNEKKKFGQDGFQSILSQVEKIENDLGIYSIEQYTPKI